MALSVVAIKAAKSRDKAYKLSDSDGLYLLIAPSGARYWRMNYRHLGKQMTLAFGVWPDTGLAGARAARDAARKVLARGDDPAERIKLDRIAATVAASNSFKAVADEWLLKIEKEGRSAATMKKLRWLLGFINTTIGPRPVVSISAQELLIMLRKMEVKGRYETSKRLRSTCSQIFRYAIATARAERDVAADPRGALIVPKHVHLAAITTPTEAGAMLRAIEALEDHPTTGLALRLLPHVFVRSGELRFAEWADFDLGKAIWTIPPHKTKTRRPHRRSGSSNRSGMTPGTARIFSLRYAEHGTIADAVQRCGIGVPDLGHVDAEMHPEQIDDVAAGIERLAHHHRLNVEHGGVVERHKPGQQMRQSYVTAARNGRSLGVEPEYRQQCSTLGVKQCFGQAVLDALGCGIGSTLRLDLDRPQRRSRNHMCNRNPQGDAGVPEQPRSHGSVTVQVDIIPAGCW